MDLFNYLTDEGKEIFEFLKDKMKAKADYHPIYELQLAMLAQSVYSYRKHVEIYNSEGAMQKPGKGGWTQVHPAFSIAQQEHAHILKLSEKFGLTKNEMNSMMKTKPKRFY